jgi:tRNA 2-thiocytidine biosynthesis protein TtcA
MQFPIIPCDLCGSQPNLQRGAMKQMLRDWEKKHPGRVENLFRAMHHIVPSHLMDREAFDFTNLEIDGSVGGALGNLGARSAGDRGIDEAELDELACGTLIRGVYN